MRDALKEVVRAVATLAVVPALISYLIRRALVGDRAFEGSLQSLALIPGFAGDYLRRAFLERTIAFMDSSATVRFGTLMSDPRARIGANVYVGPRCHLGYVDLGRDVLVAAGVHIPSGGATHGTADAGEPIRDQPITRTCVHVGEGSWIGSAAIVMADVGRHCVIGAGAVVTRPIPDFSVAAGVPARVIKTRVAPVDSPASSPAPRAPGLQ